MKISRKKMHTYYTHDNGARPFKVIVNSKAKKLSISVQPDTDNKDDSEKWNGQGYKKWQVFKFMRIWLGWGSHYPEEMGGNDGGRWTLGNTILFEKPDKQLIWIGNSGILEFQLGSDEEIIKFCSPVGNNDVSYPWIESDKTIYLLLELVTIPKQYMNTDKPYSYYYNHILKNREKPKYVKSFKVKSLHPRI